MRQKSTKDRVERFMKELGKSVSSEGSVFLTGGASAVLFDWRETTIDVDLKADPEPSGFFESLARLKNELDINIELASPDQFVPALPEWRERSQLIQRYGLILFYHYDFYGQALSKIERDHPRDRHDVEQMLKVGLVKPDRLLELFTEVEPELLRYPAIDPASLSQRVLAVVESSGKD